MTPRERPAQSHHGERYQRPDQVELFFHGQRPRVGQRGHGTCGHEVVPTGGDLPPVREVEQCRKRVHPESGIQTGRLGEPYHHRHDHQHDEQRGQQSPSPAQPECRQLDPSPFVVLVYQQSGDQIAGEHVEDVQAEEAALKPADPEVVPHDDEEGHGTEPVEGRNPLPSGRTTHGRATLFRGGGDLRLSQRLVCCVGDS